MSLTPVNYQPMSVSCDMNQKNPTVNFKGYVHKETINYVQNFAKEKFKGDKNHAKKYAEEVIKKLKNIMKNYPKGVYLKLGSHDLMNCLFADFGHCRLPKKYIADDLVKNGEVNDLKEICDNLSRKGKKKEILNMINSYEEQVYDKLEEGKNADKLINVINQLRKSIGQEPFTPNLSLHMFADSKYQALREL